MSISILGKETWGDGQAIFIGSLENFTRFESFLMTSIPGIGSKLVHAETFEEAYETLKSNKEPFLAFYQDDLIATNPAGFHSSLTNLVAHVPLPSAGVIVGFQDPKLTCFRSVKQTPSLLEYLFFNEIRTTADAQKIFMSIWSTFRDYTRSYYIPEAIADHLECTYQAMHGNETLNSKRRISNFLSANLQIGPVQRIFLEWEEVMTAFQFETTIKQLTLLREATAHQQYLANTTCWQLDGAPLHHRVAGLTSALLDAIRAGTEKKLTEEIRSKGSLFRQPAFIRTAVNEIDALTAIVQQEANQTLRRSA